MPPFHLFWDYENRPPPATLHTPTLIRLLSLHQPTHIRAYLDPADTHHNRKILRELEFLNTEIVACIKGKKPGTVDAKIMRDVMM